MELGCTLLCSVLYDYIIVHNKNCLKAAWLVVCKYKVVALPLE